jgi:hypothetical protein
MTALPILKLVLNGELPGCFVRQVSVKPRLHQQYGCGLLRTKLSLYEFRTALFSNDDQQINRSLLSH